MFKTFLELLLETQILKHTKAKAVCSKQHTAFIFLFASTNRPR